MDLTHHQPLVQAAGGKPASAKDAPRAAADAPSDAGRTAPSTADDGAASSSGASADGPSSRAFVSSPALVRRLAAATTAEDVADALSEEVPSGLREEDARAVLSFCLQRGKTALALSIYREMCLARRGGSRPGAAGRSLDVAFSWPAAGLATTTELVLGLCQQLCIVEALQVRLRGTGRGPGNENPIVCLTARQARAGARPGVSSGPEATVVGHAI